MFIRDEIEISSNFYGYSLSRMYGAPFSMTGLSLCRVLGIKTVKKVY